LLRSIFCICGLAEVAYLVHKRADSMYGSRRPRRRMFSTCYVKVLNSPCNFGKREKEVGYPWCAHAGAFCETKRPLDKLVNSICFESQHDRVRHATSINSAQTALYVCDFAFLLGLSQATYDSEQLIAKYSTLQSFSVKSDEI
jgi:hypothetical protein